MELKGLLPFLWRKIYWWDAYQEQFGMQAGPCAGSRRTWRSKRVDSPATLEGRHMSSLSWETILRPRISPTCRSDSHLSFATGSLEPFSRTMWPCSLCRIISSRSFPIVTNRHIGLYDVASPRGLFPLLSRTNLCFFQSAKNLPSQRQDLKSSRRIYGYAPITSLRISFGNPSIPGVEFALSLSPALFNSSRVKISSLRTTQELRSCLWNGSTCGNKLRTMYLTWSGLIRPGVFLLVTNLLVTILKARSHGSFLTSPIKSF